MFSYSVVAIYVYGNKYTFFLLISHNSGYIVTLANLPIILKEGNMKLEIIIK